MKLKKFESFRDHDLLEMYMVEVRNLCQQYKIVNYTINSDFSIDVEGNVDLRDLELVRLPLKFRKVKGAFYCNNNQLTSLLGSPIEVTSDFACSNNQLTTLEYSPISVNNFYCGYNQLTSLEYSPKVILGKLSCDHNFITSLLGCPKEIGTDLSCRVNPLISLAGFPQISGVFYCHGTPIAEIWELFDYDEKFLEVFEYYNLFQIPNVIDSSVMEEIAHHLGQTLPANWTLKNYTIV